MIRVSISVTAEIKAEMDQFPEINWSRVCREAIHREWLQAWAEREQQRLESGLDMEDE